MIPPLKKKLDSPATSLPSPSLLSTIEPGTAPCSVQIPSVMVAMQDGLIISNASKLSGRSLSNDLRALSGRHIAVDAIAVLCLCSIGIFQQRINLRIIMLLHRTQLSRSRCVSFYRIKALLFVLAISVRLFFKTVRTRYEARRSLSKLRSIACSDPEAAITGQFIEHSVPPDGNCIFHALTLALTYLQQPEVEVVPPLDKTRHIVIRRDIADYMRAHCDVMVVGATGMPLRDYVATECSGRSFEE